MATSSDAHLAPSHSHAVHQMWYDGQRAALGRAINSALEMLRDLQEMNSSWPVHYPSVHRSEALATTERPPSRPGLAHAYSVMGDNPTPAQHPTLRRSQTTNGGVQAESSRTAESRSTPEPRLLSSQIAQEFSVLKLDLKLGALSQVELVHSLEKNSIASLLDGKIRSSVRHLLSLRDRIEDTASKVLITGDLNAGKSTFCNALLRRKVLPVDQQPCTAIFCEVLDARENSGVEEVHAVHKDAVYSRADESTYDVFPLHNLEEVVVDSDTYTQCKIYVHDQRTFEQSLLNNGVLDIALIDAPGLNSDTTQTTAIFARQEEIDVVVFVVSAANHFTQSAKEFIWAAAAEKAYLFIVVNGFDTIRDKGRCKKMIMDQVAGLSPRTAKESSELVHFVSSNAIPTQPLPRGGPSSNGPDSGTSVGGGGGGGGDDDGDDGGDDQDQSKGKGKGKDLEKIRDFEALEESLRSFVLEKRARSKLTPARTYLLNILNDVHALATVNRDVADAELERVTHELDELEPQLKSSQRAQSEVGEKVNTHIEETCQEVYDHTRATLAHAVTNASEACYDIQYPGLVYAFQYADELKESMLCHIADAVATCENHARARSVHGVNVIKQLGILHVGNEFENLHFRSEVMFRRKRDALARQVDVTAEVWDFIDWSTLFQRQEKLAGTGMALTVATAVVPRMMGVGTWIDQALTASRLMGNNNLRQLALPALLLAGIAASAYILQQIPNSLPPRLASKISARLGELDYVHNNSNRISQAVRTVLRLPADNLRVGLDRSVRDLGGRREEITKVQGESDRAVSYFQGLADRSEAQRDAVLDVDLDAPPALVH
jgi:mitofusin